MFLLFFVFGTCARDEFKGSCLESGEILKNAKKWLEIYDVVNVSEDGKIKSTVVRFDNTKAKEYLKSKSNDLNTCYRFIKGYLSESRERHNDALFMLALINEMTYWLSGQAIEDRCKYIRMIKTRDKDSLSQWIMDDVFAPFINSEHTIKEWLSMDDRSKYEDIYEFLTVSEGKDKKCF
jgi:hypothetical protein